MKDKVIRLRKGKKGIIKEGHPWIYNRQLLEPSPSVLPGDIVSVIDPKGGLVGRGYYNPRSDISVRLLAFRDGPVNKDLFGIRVRRAFDKRKALLEKTDAVRVVFSEADGLPGLIADLYSGTVVFQILTLGMETRRAEIVKSIRGVIGPEYIYEKSDSAYRAVEGLKPVKQWIGKKGPSGIKIREGKAEFLVDIENGHKTGFYLDQRRSRMALGNIAGKKKVLDLFCYTGGFSVSAALAGASAVTGVDIKDGWLASAGKNAALNGVFGKTNFVRADAFEFLRKAYNSGEKFDIIILDPPSFARSRKDVASASKGYREINGMGMKTLAEGGILATFSCSHHISNELFSGILKEAGRASAKRITILKRCHQAEDHPIVRAIPETEYLKGYFLKVESA
ncbi:MAG: class I SAM-dependent rRNA methyltransferase [Candidatus Omnitrophota bacterium]